MTALLRGLPVVLVACLSVVTVGCSESQDGPDSGGCGDGVRGAGESCDGTDLGGATCASLQLGAGDLRCGSDCQLDTSGCAPAAACGDGVAEAGEECDGEDLGGANCESRGWLAGLLRCADGCRLDERWCSRHLCDNRVDDGGAGLVDCDDPACLGRLGCPGEQCGDGVDNDGDGMTDCEDPDCATNAPLCNAGCTFTENASFGRCSNGLDDDCDGLTDAEDPDCAGAPFILLAWDLDGGRAEAGDLVYAAATVHASEALTDLEVRLEVPEGFEAVAVYDSGSLEATGAAMEWQLGDLEAGAWRTVSAALRIAAPPAGASRVCLQAALSGSASGPSDDPDLAGGADPTCLRLP